MNTKDPNPTNSLRDLINLGPKSEVLLRKAGVKTVDELRELGSIETFYRVTQISSGTSLNLLYALEGAIHGEHWQVIAKKDKLSLLMQLEDRGLDI